ncbi:DNA-binding protein [Pandoraea iniqua]|uniref:DNA-binding protein n=1 Tax=Pandoraea iniqua TaxID=2508288 RepID=A0A5E4UJK1_9BURK|nr:hypothetical protein [Pandoraea iniqua]VVE00168.1 DNA-binding protein [Pandoraea iniqua]
MTTTVFAQPLRRIDSIRNVSESDGMPPNDRKSVIELTLEAVCESKRLKDDLAAAMGWSVSMIDKVKGGTTGVPIDKIARLHTALHLVTFTEEYADYLARGNVIGSNCHCARMNMGECGRG